MKHYKLLLSLLLVCALFCGQFSIIASAGSNNNLINPDLTDWQDVSNLQENSFPVNVTTSNNIYRVTLTDQNYPVYFGSIIDHTSLIAGHSYSLSFKMPNRLDINSAFNKDYDYETIKNHFLNSELHIGVGFISSQGVINLPEDYTFFVINKDNFSNYLGKNLNASFIASNYSGTPVVVILITSLDGKDHSFYFSNFKLVDNDDNSSELTGIKGFLHSIRWDLVGGTCEEEDCPHSSRSNPHLSLSERMSSGFAFMFQSIGDKFEKGSTLNTWFTNLANKVGNVDSSISDLGDREEGFFSNLGNSIGGFFTDLKTNMSEWFSDIGDWFSDLGDDIGGFFSDLKTKMSTLFSELGNKITSKFQEIGDSFTAYFDKFKPRVTFDFKWVSGTLSTSTGEHISSATNASVTDFFDVTDNSYYIEFINPSGEFSSGYFYTYDLNHNFISYQRVPSGSVLTLERGYSYRFRLYRGDKVEFLYGDNLSNVCNEVLVVYSEEGWLNALMYKFELKLLSLFVPSTYYMENYSTTWEELIFTRFGAVAECSNFIFDFFGNIIDYSGKEQNFIEIPAITLDLPDDASFTFGGFNVEIVNEKFVFLQNAVKVLVGFLSTIAFVYGLRKRYEEVFGGGHN